MVGGGAAYTSESRARFLDGEVYSLVSADPAAEVVCPGECPAFSLDVQVFLADVNLALL